MPSPPSAQRKGLLAVGIALVSALFFTLTYVLNRASAAHGGHWAWTACLRYFITLPLLAPLVAWQGGAAAVWKAIRTHPLDWLRCGAVGFVLFYSMLSFAASSGPSWLVAGSFQFTVIAGMLCGPFLYRDKRRTIPKAGLMTGILILGGVFLMQLSHGGGSLDAAGWFAFFCVLLSAVAYPLGNRMLLLHLENTGETLNATQRVFGMTLVTQPLWLVLAAWAWHQTGPPPLAQIGLAGGVALSAGVIATILFFQATGMVRTIPVALGAAEAMQAAELLFSMLLGGLFLGEAWPAGTALLGSSIVTAGIVVFALVVARPPASDADTMRKPRSA